MTKTKNSTLEYFHKVSLDVAIVNVWRLSGFFARVYLSMVVSSGLPGMIGALYKCVDCAYLILVAFKKILSYLHYTSLNTVDKFRSSQL